MRNYSSVWKKAPYSGIRCPINLGSQKSWVQEAGEIKPSDLHLVLGSFLYGDEGGEVQSQAPPAATALQGASGDAAPMPVQPAHHSTDCTFLRLLLTWQDQRGHPPVPMSLPHWEHAAAAGACCPPGRSHSGAVYSPLPCSGFCRCAKTTPEFSGPKTASICSISLMDTLYIPGPGPGNSFSPRAHVIGVPSVRDPCASRLTSSVSKPVCSYALLNSVCFRWEGKPSLHWFLALQQKSSLEVLNYHSF